ncbi:MAG: HlyD family efflux transporter periplasmic adaptor subunit [Parachlamydiales bacterium]|nr:HlyD family efflux transporter periplasmic adaptor subunit [Parachlamydiales bacterium]
MPEGHVNPDLRSPPQNTTPPNPHAKRKSRRIMLAVGFLILLLALVAFCYWFFHSRFYQYTDDAYVGGNAVQITSQVEGIVTVIQVDGTMMVQKGEFLAELDRTDHQLALAESSAQLAQALRSVIGLFETVEQLNNELLIAEANLALSKIEFMDREALVTIGAVAREDFMTSQTKYEGNLATVDLKKHQLLSAIAQVENTTVTTHPQVEAAKEMVRQNWVSLSRCTITAPISGMVAMKRVQIGQTVSKGDLLMTIVPLDQLWVDANFKEIQLSQIKPGQPVDITADLYGKNVVYHGRVVGISAGSGSVFSALPPQNATGNWIKVVQRVPVRISLDPEEVENHPLRLGLSINATVSISVIPTKQQVDQARNFGYFYYDTDIFSHQLNGVNEYIEKIIEDNVPKKYLKETK